MLILYLYEPSQLSHKTVHGSHVHFANEGLIDLERQLCALTRDSTRHCITIRQGEAVEVLAELHATRPIARLLGHQETGTYASFERDIAVRKWCKVHDVPFEEPACNGVVRGLRNRDKFTTKYNAYMKKPEPTPPNAEALRARLVRDVDSVGIRSPRELTAIAEAQRGDRDRQRGGETIALRILSEFLSTRGEYYNAHISAPGTAWSSCSRLSPYLAFGHISIKRVSHALTKRRAEKLTGGWPRSLSAFYSRLRWRSHFIQKLESQPDSEFRALCAPLNDVRTAPGDWDEQRFEAWRTGRTGYPMIDACMRCLIKHGWVNFRMRAMLVSFASYNLWLDWRGIAPHLARCFLDYEPGIHYPQLQMQAGVSGINAMRVYSPTKQAQEHDKHGTFIRRFVAELAKVPDEHIHEPWKMHRTKQLACGVLVAADDDAAACAFVARHKLAHYPKPIVGEASSAKKAKDILTSLRKKRETRVAAAEVLQKHGSRMNRGKRPYVADPKQRTISVGAEPRSAKARRVGDGGNTSPAAAGDGRLKQMMFPVKEMNRINARKEVEDDAATVESVKSSQESNSKSTSQQLSQGRKGTQKSVKMMLARDEQGSWTCKSCTLVNNKVNATRCRLCRTAR